MTRDGIDTIVTMALAEDAPWGDITSEAFIPADATATANLVARVPGVFSGGDIFTATFDAVGVASRVLTTDGTLFEAGVILATVEGNARAILRGERVALNLVQRMSGIATATSHYVALVAGTRARIVDTR